MEAPNPGTGSTFSQPAAQQAGRLRAAGLEDWVPLALPQWMVDVMENPMEMDDFGPSL